MTKECDVLDDVDLTKDYDEYEYNVVTTEAGECSCGGYHPSGDPVAASMKDPEEYHLLETVQSLHSVEVEVSQTPCEDKA